MEKEKSRKSGLIIAILLICLIAVGCAFVYEYHKNVELNEKLNQKSKESVESTINDENHEYTYDLSRLLCLSKTETSCKKQLEVYYNNKMHNLSIEQNFIVDGETTKISYKVNDDANSQNIEGGELFTENYKNFDNSQASFSGFVYVFDSKYLCLVLPKFETETQGHDAIVIGEDGQVIKRFVVELAATSFSYNDKDLDSISNLEFDGHTLKVWDLNSDLTSASQIGITVDNGKVSFKKLQTLSDVTVAGQGASKFENENIED